MSTEEKDTTTNNFIIEKVLRVYRKFYDVGFPAPDRREIAAQLTLAYYIEQHSTDAVNAIYSTGPQ